MINILLHLDHHIFLSDVDTIWKKYKNLNLLPPMIDHFHSYGTSWPALAYDLWGFVINGGIAAYHSNANSQEFFNTLADKCGGNHLKSETSVVVKRRHLICDDQNLINMEYVKRNVSWTQPAEMNNLIGYADFNSTSALNLMMFSLTLVLRGKNLTDNNCPVNFFRDY